MTLDLIQLASIAGAIITIVTLAKLVVEPFNKTIKKNDNTMKSLQDTIKEMVFELRESQRDRENIHKIIDLHETRIGKAEDDIIINNERIKTLFERGK